MIDQLRFANRSGADQASCVAGRHSARRDLAATASTLPAEPGRQVPDLRLRRARPGACWGYGGILSLGQGVFFGLGGYCMAMFLKLEASDAENTKIQSTPGIPDFMDWNQITALPLFWKPFKSCLHACCGHPGAGLLRLHHRRRDVQAPRRRRLLRHHHAGRRRDPDHPDRRPAGLYRRHQRHHRPADAAGLGHPHRPRQVVLYFFEVGLLFGCIFIAQFIRHRKLGRILVAMREQEDRVRFSGYSVANFKIFAFCVGGDLRRHRRRHVHAAGRIHVAVLCRHRALDRDGDLHRGRRPACRSSARSTARCSSTSPRPTFRNPSPNSGCSVSAGCSSPWSSPSPTASPASGQRLRAAADRPAAPSRKPKSGSGWTDNSVADGAPAE